MKNVRTKYFVTLLRNDDKTRWICKAICSKNRQRFSPKASETKYKMRQMSAPIIYFYRTKIMQRVSCDELLFEEAILRLAPKVGFHLSNGFVFFR